MGRAFAKGKPAIVTGSWDRLLTRNPMPSPNLRVRASFFIRGLTRHNKHCMSECLVHHCWKQRRHWKLPPMFMDRGLVKPRTADPRYTMCAAVENEANPTGNATGRQITK